MMSIEVRRCSQIIGEAYVPWIELVAFRMLLVAALAAMGCSTETPISVRPAQFEQAEFRDKDLTSAYRDVLRYVDDSGLVDYAGLQHNRQTLDQFAGFLSNFSPQIYEVMSSPDQIAFWINAYNGLTLLAIVNHYPIEPSFIGSLRFPENSIRQISGVWDQLRFEILGATFTLDQIEHEILRKRFTEPRIHVALVCAALSCPPLKNKPYSGSQLTEQFDSQVRKFLRNPKNFRIDSSSNTVYISKIFEWYGDDFIAEFGNREVAAALSRKEMAVMSYIAENLEPSEAGYLMEEEYAILYLDYDWTLNEKKR